MKTKQDFMKYRINQKGDRFYIDTQFMNIWITKSITIFLTLFTCSIPMLTLILLGIIVNGGYFLAAIFLGLIPIFWGIDIVSSISNEYFKSLKEAEDYILETVNEDYDNYIKNHTNSKYKVSIIGDQIFSSNSTIIDLRKKKLKKLNKINI